MHAFKFEIANVYANLSNVVLRLAPADPAAAGHKALLVNRCAPRCRAGLG